MHSSRDVAAANAFHRQRLVAAFVSQRCGESPERPPRTLRCVVVGLLISVVCAVGAGVGGVVSGHPEISWEQGGPRVTP